MNLKTEISKFVEHKGVDCIGFAPIQRWDMAPSGFKPTDVLKTCKTVIVLGLNIGKGLLIADKKALKEGFKPATFPYQHFGHKFHTDILSEILFWLSRFIEKNGHLTVPCPPGRPYDIANLRGTISNRHAAVAAGLGEFGWHNLVITPSVGSRIRFATILTEAEIEPDPLYSGPKLCKPDQCGYLCARACPINAIEKEDNVIITIEEKRYEYAVLDKWRCRAVVRGLINNPFYNNMQPFELPEKMDAETYLELERKKDPWLTLEMNTAISGSACGKCLINCPIGA